MVGPHVSESVHAAIGFSAKKQRVLSAHSAMAWHAGSPKHVRAASGHVVQ
jgi:hypothetical protein